MRGKLFIEKMFATYRVAVNQAIPIVDRKVWLSLVALPKLALIEFDDEHDGDANATKPLPLLQLQPINVYSSTQRPYRTAFAVATANIVK